MPSLLNQTAIFGCILVAFFVFFCLPVCNAFQASLASAREPAHRVTPRYPWEFFRRTFQRKLRWWRMAWLGILVIYVFLSVFFPKSFDYGFRLGARIMAVDLNMLSKTVYKPLGSPMASLTLRTISELPAILFGLSLLFTSACWCLSPRCQKMWELFGLSLVSSLTLYAPVLLASFFGMPPKFSYVILEGSDARTLQSAGMGLVQESSLAPLVVLPFFLIIYCVIRLWVHWQGDKWFRFEE